MLRTSIQMAMASSRTTTRDRRERSSAITPAKMAPAGEAMLWQVYDSVDACQVLLLRGADSDLLSTADCRADDPTRSRRRGNCWSLPASGHAPTLVQPEVQIAAVARDSSPADRLRENSPRPSAAQPSPLRSASPWRRRSRSLTCRFAPPDHAAPATRHAIGQHLTNARVHLPSPCCSAAKVARHRRGRACRTPMAWRLTSA